MGVFLFGGGYYLRAATGNLFVYKQMTQRNIMAKCIIREMIKVFFASLWEFLQILLAFMIVLGLPVGALWVVNWLILKYLGEPIHSYIVVVFLLSGLVVAIIFAIRDLYLKAKENCERS